MNPRQYEQARELFHRLADRDEDERRRVLEAEDVDTTVAEGVRRLLDQEPRDDAFAEARLGDFGPELLREADGGPTPELVRAGPYDLIERLGAGGMGVVYRGRRTGGVGDPGATVAIKVLHPGPASRELLRRFRREAEVLSRLDHPGIAGFLGAGTGSAEDAAGGRRSVHYLAMEDVRGTTLLRHAERLGLGESGRLELMARVCDALQAAHEAGVVHRDIKPANVLVASVEGDPLGQPKVLDFGVARHTGEGADSLTLTEAGAVLGTVPYMSPEQVSGGSTAVTTASDVYSLGVLLHELLTGRLPYPVRGLPLPAAARIIRETPPRRLPTRAGGPGAADLEIVLARTLEKQPGDRLGSAAELAAELRRVRAGHPVRSRRPSWTTRSRRFVARNKTLTAVVSGVLLALVVGLVVATGAALREARLRATADRSAADARRAAHHARLQNAVAALEAHDVAHASQLLDACEPGLRGWAWAHLHSRLDDSIARAVVPGVQVGQRVDLAAGPDGRQVLVLVDGMRRSHLGERRYDVHRWDVAAGDVELVRTLHGVLAAAITADGAELAHLSADGTLIRERFSDGALLARTRTGAIGNDSFGGTFGALAPDGPVAFKLGRRGVLLWDGEAGSTPEEVRYADWLAADPAQRWHAYQDDEGRTRLVDRRSTESHPGAFPGQPLAVAPRGTLAVVDVGRRQLDLWAPQGVDRTEADRRHVGIRLPRGEAISDIVFEPVGRRALVTGASGALRLVSTQTGEVLRDLHGGGRRTREAHFLPGNRAVTLDIDGELRLWDLGIEAGRPPAQRQGVSSVAVHGSRLVFTTRRGDLGALREDDRALTTSVTLHGAPALEHLAISSDGRLLAAVDRVSAEEGGRRVLIVEPATGSSRAVERPDDRPWRGALALAWAPGSGLLAVQDQRGGVELIDARRPDLPRTARRQASGAGIRGALSWAPDGRLLAARLEADRAGILDPVTLELLRELPCEGAVLTALAWSPDGALVAGAFRDEVVRLWDPAEGSLVRTLEGHAKTVTGLAWSPDGALLATGSKDDSVRLWDVVHGEEVLRLAGRRETFRELVFTEDGGALVGVASDGLWTWDTRPLGRRMPSSDVPTPSRELLHLLEGPPPVR